MAEPLTRADYADRFGPTTGDRIRLADTNLRIEISDDWSGGPGRSGNEVVFGGGKVIRESMGQSCAPRDSEGRRPDTVITGAVILDHWGIVKADVAIRDGRITALGKAYNDETMDRLHDGHDAGHRLRHRSRDRGHRGQRQDPHRRRGRHPRPLHLPRADRRGAGLRRHHAHRRRHRPGGGQHRHHRHARLLAHRPDVRGAGRLPGQHRAARQGQHHVQRVAARPGGRGRPRLQDPRGLGCDPRRPARCLQVCQETGVQLALHADSLNEAGFVAGHHRRHRRPLASTSSTSRAPAAATPRT